MAYRQKIVETPSMTRVYTYARPVRTGQTKDTTITKRENGQKLDRNISRTKEGLALTIQCNVRPYSKFATFTTKENITDRSEFLQQWRTFTRRFRRKFGYTLKYSAVTETQERGAWHIHAVLYNATEKIDLDKLTKCWAGKNAKGGEVDVKVVDHHKHLFKYLVKYLTKDELQLNKKAVLNSEKLEQPSITHSSQPLGIADMWGNPDYSKEWALYHGDLKKHQELGSTNEQLINYCTMQEYIKTTK